MLDYIIKLQERAGYQDLQKMIDTGDVWYLEGAMGRAAMDALRSGACWLPEESYRDYYGNGIPSRNELEPGTTGTLENSINYYDNLNY